MAARDSRRPTASPTPSMAQLGRKAGGGAASSPASSARRAASPHRASPARGGRARPGRGVAFFVPARSRDDVATAPVASVECADRPVQTAARRPRRPEVAPHAGAWRSTRSTRPRATSRSSRSRSAGAPRRRNANGPVERRHHDRRRAGQASETGPRARPRGSLARGRRRRRRHRARRAHAAGRPSS